ncbi:MAG TPA: Co2+/Mg2+ efflux protein ApaG [Proteus sp.]|uniref:Protein ApaG n=1 Tax=Proteus hauseri ATCC 700826 TaxID=1354271 RepID=A0AAJ3HPT4_PROHU|nr:Co2+/Mg2+ efflux protein ApaG [Proteus hauseri]OAT45085.1 ApaG family protein [Proteus hauseri ATCC 700826]HCH51533.1 Co2+/Mg2+ efflux protein ApaG [Proteus sp. (in: enterobacteria)]
MFTSSKVAIQVQSVYIESQSSPDNQRYVFAYTVSIHNLNKCAIRLLRRYWLITNAQGHTTEVQGEGVVGEQPLIEPGTQYRYTSGAVLETPMGTMEGHYEMIDANGRLFQIEIPVFRLALPTLIN